MEACFTAGADPELMIVNPQGELVSAIGRVPGTKKRPHRVEKGAIQRDNVNAEFNVHPAENLEDFRDNIRAVLQALDGKIAPDRLVVRASAEFPAKCLRHREARRFGCDPDFDAWELALNMVPAEAALSPLRSAGGHLHIGKKPGLEGLLDDPMGKVMVVRMLDIFVGIPSIVLDTDPTSALRRALYGKAGAHRPKPYGVEYRSLGNFWVRTPNLTGLIYRLADLAVKVALEPAKAEALIDGPFQAGVVQRIINESRVGEAADLIDVELRKLIGDNLTDLVLDPGMPEPHLDLYMAWELN